MAESRTEEIEINKDMEYSNIIAFRSDTRDPFELFNFGFQRRSSTFTFFKENKFNKEPTFRSRDIDPVSAVCVTKEFDLAPLFPLNTALQDSWIYIVRLQQAFPTFRKQQDINCDLQFCQELATRDIPSGDVIAAIHCKRYWNLDEKGNADWQNGMHYKLADELIWNPKLKNEIKSKMKKKIEEEIIGLIEKRRNKYIECPIPVNEDDIKAVQNGSFSYGIRELSEQEHSDRELLAIFVKKLSDYVISANDKDQQEALEALKKCSDLNKIIPCVDMTPLMYACQCTNTLLVEFLLARNVDLDIKDPDGFTAQDYANQYYDTHPDLQQMFNKDYKQQKNTFTK